MKAGDGGGQAVPAVQVDLRPLRGWPQRSCRPRHNPCPVIEPKELLRWPLIQLATPPLTLGCAATSNKSMQGLKRCIRLSGGQHNLDDDGAALQDASAIRPSIRGSGCCDAGEMTRWSERPSQGSPEGGRAGRGESMRPAGPSTSGYGVWIRRGDRDHLRGPVSAVAYAAPRRSEEVSPIPTTAGWALPTAVARRST
jgi:hypothetical protein